MDMRTLGRTGLQVAPLCLGGNVFGWSADEAASFEVLDAYAAAGGNFIDTADVYSRWVPGHSGGESELVLGRWMHVRGNRAEMIIATKVASGMADAPNRSGLSRQWIMRAVEDSLGRLQTDYIDLYQAHWDDQNTPLEETLRAFDDLIRQGKVRYIGASNYRSWRLMQALWTSDRHNYASYVCLQPRYNLVVRDEYEQELEPLCRSMGIGVIPYAALAGGFLSGKYRRGDELPQSVRADSVKQRYMHERGFAVLDAVLAVAERHNAKPAQVALAWLLHRPGITAPIASATSAAQLQELLGSLTLKLSDEDVKALDG
ncbi:MAG: aldo/keto reductase [Oscillochloris sp.]|nr:aldo/keto reductase [Oscillochloris sp.]